VLEAVLWLLARGLLVALLAATAWALGRRLTRGLAFSDPLERFVLASSLGLAALGGCLFLLGLAGLLTRWAVATLGVGVNLAAWSEWRLAWRALVAWVRTTSAARMGSGWQRPAIALATVGLLPLLLLTLYPPIEFDALVYHLPHARGFASSGQLPFFERSLYPVFPPHQELLFAATMLFGSDVDTQLISCWQLALVALLIWRWGRGCGRRWVAPVASGLWLGTPLAVWHGATPYVDIALSLYGASSIYGWWRWRDDGDRRWANIAMAMAAAAAAVKYLGLFFPVFVGAALLLKGRRRPAAVLGALLLGALLTAPWYARIWALTGNPVFPYYPEIFGSSAWDPPTAGDAMEAPEAADGALALVTAEGEKIIRGLTSLATLPYDMVFRRHLYDQQAPFSPWLLLALPIGGLVALTRRGARSLLVPVLLYSLAWLVTTREPRFLLAVLPPLLVALGIGAEGLLERLPWRGVGVSAELMLVVALALPGPAYVAVKLVERGPLPISPAARSAFLRDEVPGYGALEWLDRHTNGTYTAYARHAPWLAYHSRGQVLGAAFGPFAYRRLGTKPWDEPAAALGWLRAAGVTYMVETTFWDRVPNRLPRRFTSHLQRLAAGPGWQVFEVPAAGSGSRPLPGGRPPTSSSAVVE
jgi:hypothetical protein